MQDAVLNLVAASSCAISYAWSVLATWKNTRSIRTERLAMRSRAAATPAAAAARLDTQVQGLGNRPERLHLLHDPGAELGANLPGDRRPEWAQDPRTPTAHARQAAQSHIFAGIEKWLADKTKFEAINILRKFECHAGRCCPLKELAYDPFLRPAAASSRCSMKTRGTYLTVGAR